MPPQADSEGSGAERNVHVPPGRSHYYFLNVRIPLPQHSNILTDLNSKNSVPLGNRHPKFIVITSPEILGIWGKNGKKEKKKSNRLGPQLGVVLQFTALSLCFITPLLKSVTKSQPRNPRMKKFGMGQTRLHFLLNIFI